MRDEYTKQHWRPKREVQFCNVDDILVFAEDSDHDNAAGMSLDEEDSLEDLRICQ